MAENRETIGKFHLMGGYGFIYKYEDDGRIVMEIWGGSTKHPDVVNHFNDFEKSAWVDEEHQIFQWLLECASKLCNPVSAKELAEYALAEWITWERD